MLVSRAPRTSTAAVRLPNGCRYGVDPDARDTGHDFEALQEVLEELARGARVSDIDDSGNGTRIVSTRDVSNPSVDALQGEERANHQTRSDEEHERQRDLADHEALAQQRLATVAAHRAARFAQGTGEARRGGVKRGQQAEDERRQHGDGPREEQHGHVERDLRLVGNGARRHEREERAQRTGREERAQQGRGQRNQQALDEQRPDDAPPTRADRAAQGDLVAPIGRASEQQVRDVGARDEQQESDGAEERPQIASDTARKGLLEREQARRASVSGNSDGYSALQVRDDRPEVRLGVRVGDVRLQAPEQMHVAHALVVAPRLNATGM